MPISTIKSQSGLSLPEAIVAIAVLVVGLFSGILVASYGISTMTYTRHYQEANHLAAEGLETVRAVRDSNWLNKTAWTLDLAPGSYIVIFDSSDGRTKLQKNNGLAIDFGNLENTLSEETRVFNVTEPPETPYFTQDPNTVEARYATVFYRQVDITDTPAVGPIKKRIRSSVIFRHKTNYKVVQLEEDLYDWKK